MTSQNTAGPRAVFADGLRSVWPLVFGIAPFGLVVGATAADGGLSLVDAAGFSLLVFAGASQLAGIDLAVDGAPVVVAIGTVLVINARMLMYSASLAPYLSDVSLRGRLGLSYFLTDQMYALAVVRWERPEGRGHEAAFYLGVMLPLWSAWQVTTVLGHVAGSSIPDDVPLGFSVALVFIAVLVPTLTDRPRVVAGLVSATVAIALRGLPANLALPCGAAAGIAAGTFVDARWGRT